MKTIEAVVRWKDQYGKPEGKPFTALFAYNWTKEEEENFDLDQQIFYYLDDKEDIEEFTKDNNGNSEFYVISYE